jgi:hypothetical protein
MSTYEQAYSNTTTDLVAVVPELESYDQKKLITNWVLHSGQVYRADSVGFISQLYKNGKDLGAAESSLVNVDDDNKWYYDSANDVVYIDKESNPPNEDRMEAGIDWVTLKTRVNNEQSERIRSYVGRPLLPRKGVGTESASSRQWDWILIRSNALLTCAELIRPFNQEKAEMLERQAIDPEFEMGLLDRLKKGDYKLWNETTSDKVQGVRDVAIDATTTGSIIDIKGEPTSTDILKIQIQTGGTLVSGSASTLTYSVWGGNSSGVKVSQIVNAQILTGGWDFIGHGVSMRMSPGLYVALDEWEVELMGGESVENPSIKVIQATR